MNDPDESLHEHNRRVYISVYALIILFMVLVSAYTQNINFLNKSNTIARQAEDFNTPFVVHELAEGEEPLFTYQLTLSEQSFEALSGEEYRLIINGLKDNAIQVWFNDDLIISEGDLEKGHSMMRSGHVYGSIHASKILENNQLVIQTYADYRTGIDQPLLISEKRVGDRAIRLLDLSNNEFIFLGLGLMLMSILSLVFLYELAGERDLLIIYLVFATILIGIYFLDFLPISYLAQSYLNYKKILLLSLALGIYFYGKAIEELLRKKHVMILPTIQLIYYIWAMLISNHLIQFENYYQYFYAALILTGVNYLIFSFIHRREDIRIFVLTLHFSTIVILGIITLWISQNHSYFSIQPQIFMMITVAFLPLLLTIDLLVKKEANIQVEKRLRNVAYSKSITDDLTGVWNKRYLESRIHNLTDRTIIALVDLDNLKMINDGHGHLAGDRALRRITEEMKKYLQAADDIFRYGGDEFVVQFDDHNLEEAIEAMERIRKSVAEHPITHNDEIIHLTISIGMAVTKKEVRGEDVVELADQRLYRAKENGKNQLVYPDGLR